MSNNRLKEEVDSGYSRRDVLRRGGVTVFVAGGLSSVVEIAAADTSSGNVELTTVASVPTNTTISITIFEDTNGDGAADRQQTKSIPDGTNTVVYDLLQSSTAQGDVLWIRVELSTSDDAVTPTLDSASIALPETTDDGGGQVGGDSGQIEPDDPQGLGELWQNYQAIVALVVIGYAGIGLWSKSLTLAAWSGYLAFLYIAFSTGTPLFEGIAMVTLVLVFLGFAFKLVRLEFGDEE